jgi:UDPglucose--hexose-1-phosphate uridylyltransferase
MEQLNLNDHPHRRLNILTGEWVLVSPHRTKRPWQGKVETLPLDNRPTYDPKCYLCPGNERSGGEKNPVYTETYSFQNDFGALLADTPTETIEKGLLKAKGESGICKVICFSPNHALTIPEMEVKDLVKVIEMWQKEYQELGTLDFINHVQIFENKGDVMGCSNPHPHGQIWAQNTVPQEVAKKGAIQKKYFQEKRRSLLGEYLTQELQAQERIILQNDHFVALVPYWAVWPYEAMIIPRRQMQNVAQLNETEKEAFASILKGLTTRFDNLFNTSFPYSAGIHQAPTDGQDYPEWHWHMSFYPPLLRSATVKKFMVGYEMFANPQRDITAEQAAEKLRGLPNTHYKAAP